MTATFPTTASSNIGRLAELEAVIERGLETFITVGRALTEIRDEGLYKETHGTFEEYCRERWRIERAHAYRLIEATKVVENLSPIGDIPLPTSESVARELKPLPPERQREAWARAVEQSKSGQPTASEVSTVVAGFSNARTTKPTTPRPASRPIPVKSPKQLRKCHRTELAEKQILRIVKAYESGHGHPSIQALIIHRPDGVAIRVEIVVQEARQ